MQAPLHGLIKTAAFTELFGSNRSPNIQLFKRHELVWPKIDKGHFETTHSEVLSSTLAYQVQQEVLSFFLSHKPSGRAYV